MCYIDLAAKLSESGAFPKDSTSLAGAGIGCIIPFKFSKGCLMSADVFVHFSIESSIVFFLVGHSLPFCQNTGCADRLLTERQWLHAASSASCTSGAQAWVARQTD
jgi:hypothetical protein